MSSKIPLSKEAGVEDGTTEPTLDPSIVGSPKQVKEHSGNEDTLSKVQNCVKSKVIYDIKTEMWFAYGVDIINESDIVIAGGHQIGIFSSDGKHKKWIEIDDIKFAFDVKVKGQYLYVSDIENDHRKVVVLDLEGVIQRTIKMPENEQEHNCYHLGLAFDQDDNLYIASFQTVIVYKFETGSTKPEPFLTQESHPNLDQPMYLCVTDKQELIVSTMRTTNIQAYDLNGKLLWIYRGKETGVNELGLCGPYGMCYDKDGNIYICDHYRQRIQIVKDGAYVGCIKPQNMDNPQTIAINCNQELLIVMFERLMKVILEK